MNGGGLDELGAANLASFFCASFNSLSYYGQIGRKSMKSFLSKTSIQSAAVAVGVALSSAPAGASVAPGLSQGQDKEQSELMRALSSESEQFETFNRETGRFESISLDDAKSLAFDEQANTLTVSKPVVSPQVATFNPPAPNEVEESSGATVATIPEGAEPESVDPSSSPSKPSDPICFVRFPGQDQCLVSSDTALRLAKRVTSIALLNNPTGLAAYSAYRLLATDDPKSEVLLDAVAGQGVAAATVVSIGRSAQTAFEPDDSPTTREVINAMPIPLSEREKDLGVALLNGAGVALGVSSALSSSAGPVAGLVDLGVSAGASTAGKVLGLQPEIIKDPGMTVNIIPSAFEGAITGDVGIDDLLVRNTPTFIESGSVSLPGTNKVFARDWSADHILMTAPTLKTSLHNQGLELPSDLQYRDFIYESEMDGKLSYVGLGVLSSAGGQVYFESETGPFNSREEARLGMNHAASEVMHSDPFNLLAKGFSPMEPGSFGGFASSNGRPILEKETELVRERALGNGDSEISFTSYTPAKGVEVVTSIYDKEVMQLMPPELSIQDRHKSLLNVAPKAQHTELTPDWVNPIAPSVAQKGPSQSGLSM